MAERPLGHGENSAFHSFSATVLAAPIRRHSPFIVGEVFHNLTTGQRDFQLINRGARKPSAADIHFPHLFEMAQERSGGVASWLDEKEYLL